MMIERPNTPRTSYSPKHLSIYSRARMCEEYANYGSIHHIQPTFYLDERQTTTYSLVIHGISETSWCVRITKTLDWERTKGEASVDGLMGVQAFGIKLAGLVYLI